MQFPVARTLRSCNEEFEKNWDDEAIHFRQVCLDSCVILGRLTSFSIYSIEVCEAENKTLNLSHLEDEQERSSQWRGSK